MAHFPSSRRGLADLLSRDPPEWPRPAAFLSAAFAVFGARLASSSKASSSGASLGSQNSGTAVQGSKKKFNAGGVNAAGRADGGTSLRGGSGSSGGGGIPGGRGSPAVAGMGIKGFSPSQVAAFSTSTEDGVTEIEARGGGSGGHGRGAGARALSVTPGSDASATEEIRAGGEAATPPGQVNFARKDLVMLFTCTKCETRSAKAFSKDSYERGIVLVTCPGCGARHLIADNLGWFGSEGNLKDFAAEKGFSIRHREGGDYEISPEDVAGVQGAPTPGSR